MAWFDETCINSNNKGMNDVRITIKCVGLLHCTYSMLYIQQLEELLFDIIGLCMLYAQIKPFKDEELNCSTVVSLPLNLQFLPSKHMKKQISLWNN